jgi:hypothetical protein
VEIGSAWEKSEGFESCSVCSADFKAFLGAAQRHGKSASQGTMNFFNGPSVNEGASVYLPEYFGIQFCGEFAY